MVFRPEANPTINLAGIMKYMFGARAIIRPPIKNIQVLISMAPRRPLVLANVPPTKAPKGPPTANAETATGQSIAVMGCVGKTMPCDGFITPVL